MKKTTKKGQARSALTKEKLLLAAIQAFANKGFEGVGTRELAKGAGANLSAIRYHFGDKEGLYRAVVQYISEGIRMRVAPFVEEVLTRADRPGISRDELIDLLCHLITSFASQLLSSGIADNWARLITREQVSPTTAFPVLYNVFRLLIEAAAIVLGKITRKNPDSERVRISVMTIVGQTLVFRTHRATAMKFIGWKEIGSHQVSQLQSVVSDQCRALLSTPSELER